jgi:hypothetical protein
VDAARGIVSRDGAAGEMGIMLTGAPQEDEEHLARGRRERTEAVIFGNDWQTQDIAIEGDGSRQVGDIDRGFENAGEWRWHDRIPQGEILSSISRGQQGREVVTGEEWLQCRKAEDMVHFLSSEQTTFRTRWQRWRGVQRFKVSERQWRLLCCACVFRIADLIPVTEARRCVVVSEQYAEGLVGDEELREAIEASMAACTSYGGDRLTREWQNAVSRVHRTPGQALVCLGAVVRARALATFWNAQREEKYVSRARYVTEDPVYQSAQQTEEAAQADLLRDIVGNPFQPRPAFDPQWQSWRRGLIPTMAQQIHDERRYENLPILADMLEEAGCDNEAILAHCRGPGPHVRGCWVVDWLLAKS